MSKHSFPFRSSVRVLLPSLLLAAMLAGCGKPPAPGGGPPPDMAVQAVVGLAERRPIEEKLSLVGNFGPKDAIEVRSEIEARITEIGFSEGLVVQPGHVLARLDADKLEAEVAEARARAALAAQDFERGKTLVARKTISTQQFDQYRSTLDETQASLRLAEERLADAVLVAPFTGVIGARLVSVGQYLDRGQMLTTLVRIDPLTVEFNVPERYVSQVAPAQTIAITTAAWPGETFTGTVYFLSPVLDAASRTLQVKAYVENPDQRLRPGMFANLDLVFRVSDEAIVVPESALSFRTDKASLVVMNDEGRAEMREVKVGMRLAGQAEITEGLAAGEKVVVEGSQKLAPGMRITIAPESSRYGVTPPPAATAATPAADKKG